MYHDLTTETIKKIVENLDCGMQCYYHKKTGEVESYPDENCMPGFDEDDWEEVMNKVENDRDNYIAFVPMDSFEGFQMRQDFIEQIADISIRNEGLDYMSKRKPFQQFNFFLSDYPDHREKWFAYKDEQYEAYVKQHLELHMDS